MGDSDIDPNPANGNAHIPRRGGAQDRQEWVGANFTQIFGISAKDLQTVRLGFNRASSETVVWRLALVTPKPGDQYFE
jgi:hypothetical protein